MKAGIRTRLTLLFVSIFGTTLTLFSLMLYRYFAENQQREFDAQLYNHTVDIVQGLDFNFFGDLSIPPAVLSESTKLFPFSVGRSFLQIRDLRGSVVARSNTLARSSLPFQESDLSLILSHGNQIKTIKGSEIAPVKTNFSENYRLLNYLVDKPPLPKLILQVAVPLTSLKREKAALITFFAVGIPLVLIIATLGGFFLSARALAPVKAIINKAKGLDAGRLSERVPVPEVHDEISRLALTLNEFLDRNQKAFESQERFIADASHQIKTPLSILKGELEVLLSRERSPEEMKEFMKSARQEIDHLSRMVQDLLLLARVDAGVTSLSVAPVQVSEAVLEAVSLMSKFAESRGVTIRLDIPEIGDFEVQGDADLLTCIFQNLIENAIKFSPRDCLVEVKLSAEPGAVGVQVKDRGYGIPADIVPRIFDRFFRAESTKSISSGTGLGLAIAQRIAEIHGGKISVESVPDQGSTFMVQLPKN
ncbi:MAG: sensor histidine kinase [Bacteriovoracia bacterium]